MAKKQTKPDTPDTPDKDSSVGGTAKSPEVKDPEQQIKMLIEKGQNKGFLTYEEMSEDLSDESISPSRLDGLLVTLDEMGISLLDEADVESQQAAKAEGEFPTPEEPAGEEETSREEPLKEEDELLEKELVGEEGRRRIDDPIRMYLTQMGRIPLLMRKD
ncbi:MAG: hypothetical protein NTX52_01720, partial [Planctomycetota bacterium]|nr:hypothetical protein [Planctomycetota bacterium]